MELRGTYKGGGGPDKTILLSAAKHSTRDFFVLVTYLRDPSDHDFQIGNMASFYGVPDYIEVMDRSMLDMICVAELNTLIKKHSIEIIHVHDLKTTLLGVILKMINPRVKIMHTAHGWIIHSKVDLIKQKLQYALLRCYPVHISVSEATRSVMIKSGIPADSIQVIYNSIDTRYWQKGNGIPSLRNEYGIQSHSMVIGTVGRLSREKDLPTFFNVAKRIISQYPDTVFFIVVDGKADIVEELKELLNVMGLTNNIILAGHRTDLLNVYASFDLFLMTSLTEGLPNTVQIGRAHV
jgi:glycosyltransferase involved in cell wall biosynthesis